MNMRRIALWIITVAVVACVSGYGLRRFEVANDSYHRQMKILLNPRARGQWAFGMYRCSVAQCQEWKIMRHNLAGSGQLFWYKTMGDAMLLKANWVANRLNLPLPRPIQPWQVDAGFEGTVDCVLPQYPSWIPDTVYGLDIYNTNISRLKRLMALKIAVNGWFDTPAYHFSFKDGQCDYVARQSENGGDPSGFEQVMAAPHVHPALKTAEIYQIATNWLAALDVNLDMLEKSRLPHPVRQEQYQPPGAPGPQPVYFVAWGTNYYGLNYMSKILYTNEWSPSVLVEIGPHKELLRLFVGDLTYYRNPPILIPSPTVWRVIHTPDPPLEQLQNPAVMAQFFRTLSYYTNYPDADYDAHYLTNSLPWRFAHNQWSGLDPRVARMEQDIEMKDQIGIIPYKPGDDPVFDTNRP